MHAPLEITWKKRNASQRWHGPARIIDEDPHGFWLIDNGTPILCSPDLMRPSTLNEVQSRKQDDLGQPPDQRGFVDSPDDHRETGPDQDEMVADEMHDEPEHT